MDIFDINNPLWSTSANVVSAAFNIPVDRLLRKYNNIESAITGELETWQRIALVMGWSEWDLGIKDVEIQEIKDQ